jgi:phosphate transport system ATP-binding protein
MSIYDNVLAGKRLNSKRLKKARPMISSRSRSLARTSGTEVKDRLSRPGSGLSGGPAAAAVHRPAIAVEPEVLLMDEPCSASTRSPRSPSRS